jgi:hypothetical protein
MSRARAYLKGSENRRLHLDPPALSQVTPSPVMARRPQPGHAVSSHGAPSSAKARCLRPGYSVLSQATQSPSLQPGRAPSLSKTRCPQTGHGVPRHATRRVSLTRSRSKVPFKRYPRFKPPYFPQPQADLVRPGLPSGGLLFGLDPRL